MGRPHQETGHRQCAPPPTYADLARNWAASYSTFRQIAGVVDFAILQFRCILPVHSCLIKSIVYIQQKFQIIHNRVRQSRKE